MLEAERALAMILERVERRPVREVALDDGSAGRVLARDLVAPFDLPRFENSAMDGYALRAADLAAATTDAPVELRLRSRVFAGDDASAHELEPGACALITTGAEIPPGADAVVPREWIAVRGDRIEFRTAVAAGAHVRPRGEDLKAGQAVLAAGTTIGAGQIALLASLGYDRVPVFAAPAISILPTGSELVDPGGSMDRAPSETAPRLAPGQIFESNGRMLQALLAEEQLASRRWPAPRDEREALSAALREALAADVVLISGGVSVGDRDYVREELARLGVREVFWRVKVKPGKPFYFGMRAGDTDADAGCFVFGLPGNPASGYVVFEEFVRPALRKMCGRIDVEKPLVSARLERTLKPAPDRRTYARARLERRGDAYYADPHAFQGSHGLAALAAANGLVILPAGDEPVAAGSLVEARVLRGAEALL